MIRCAYAQDFKTEWEKFSKEMQGSTLLPVKTFEEFEKKNEKRFNEFPSEGMKFYGHYAYSLLNEKDDKNALEALKYCYHYSTLSTDTTLKAIAVYRFGDYYRLIKNFTEAEKYYASSLAPLAAIIGASSREYSDIYFEYMTVLIGLGKYVEAKPGIEALLYYYKTLDGEKSKHYLELTSLYADIHKAQGDYEKSIQLLKPLVEQSVFLDLKDTSTYLSTLIDIGDVYREYGRYNEALFYFKKTKQEYYRLRSKDGMLLANIENDLALCYKMSEQLKESEESFDMALRIYTQEGKEHSRDYCVTLNNKGDLFRELGRHGLASEILLKSLLIQKQNADTISRVYANTLNNLGLVYMDAGYYDEALRRTEQARDLYEKLLGKDHQYYGNCVNNLSFLYMMKNDYRTAQEFKLKALNIIEKSTGKNNFRYITFLISAGGIAMHLKELPQAEGILKEAVFLSEKNFGVNHELTARAKLLLGEVLAEKGDFENAALSYTSSLNAFVKQIDSYFDSMSEENQAHYFTLFEPAFQSFNLFLLNYRLSQPKKNIDDLIRSALSYQLLLKSMLGRNAAALQRTINTSSDTELKKVYSEWVKVKNRLINITKFNSDVNEENELVKKASELEAILKTKVGTGFKKSNSDFYAIQKALKMEEAALEIFRVHERINDSTSFVKYGAMVIRKDKVVPELIVLKNGGEMEGKSFDHYSNCLENDLTDSISYAVYFEAIEKKLKGINRLYVSADGIYQKISLAGLMESHSGKFVAENISVVMVPNLSGIESRNDVVHTTDFSAALFGCPDFEYDFVNARTSKEAIAGVVAKRYGLSGLSQLPGTKTEVNNIAASLKEAKWKVELYTDENASEKNVRKQHSPTVLHIATHGYYLSDIETENEFFLGFESKNFKENSYLRSGILLAGAGPSSNDSLHIHSENDGVLTAYDATLMDLAETELVVLSACQTGLGDNMGSQGVAGLQRAFAVAGAKNIIMSLWPVEDQSTQYMMSEFYREYTKGLDIETSFRKAQTACRKKHPHPSYWAAFVLLKGLK